MIYLDNAGTTKLSTKALNAMLPFFTPFLSIGDILYFLRVFN